MNKIKPVEIYDLILDIISSDNAIIEELMVGLTWTYCRSDSVGLCMTAESRSRTFEWPGSLKGQLVSHVAHWIRDWDPMKSTIAMAAINSVINRNSIDNKKTLIQTTKGAANLAVFEYFLPLIKGKNTVVIGRYPGLEVIKQQHDLKVIELNPAANDLPAQSCEYVLPEAEWVFLTGTSIANKTFPRLMELSKNSNVVLMGPTVPWLDELSVFGVDFLAGIQVVNDQRLKQIVSEGGGVNIFSEAVQYLIYDLGSKKLEQTRGKISDIVHQREMLKDEMEIWYKNISHGTFPKVFELVALDEQLSVLDSQYKKMWDLRSCFKKMSDECKTRKK